MLGLEIKQRWLIVLLVYAYLSFLSSFGSVLLRSGFDSPVIEPFLEPVKVGHLLVGELVHSDVVRHFALAPTPICLTGYIEVNLAPITTHRRGQRLNKLVRIGPPVR